MSTAVEPAGARPEASVRTVGVVGLGKMGAPIAAHLLRHGHSVVGVDLDPAAGADLVAAGMQRADGADDLAGVEICLVLVEGRSAERVLLADGGYRPALVDCLTLVCSTVEPEPMRALHAAADGAGARLLDAPLCRGDHGARQGDLLALVGGSRELLAECEDVLRAFCSEVVHVGGPGAGQVAKLVNNLLLWANITSIVEALQLGEALGVRRAPLVQALLPSSARSWVLETWQRPRALPWAHEDMRMVLEASTEAGLSLPLSGLVHELIKGIRSREVLRDGGFQADGWQLPAHEDGA
jgi:3-hydroxyisobutyrate dehydrogenase-like beta-hydroxyacid dehydrogenase